MSKGLLLSTIRFIYIQAMLNVTYLNVRICIYIYIYIYMSIRLGIAVGVYVCIRMHAFVSCV